MTNALNAVAPGQIVAIAHAGRSILSSATTFADAGAAVWEYVINGIEYNNSDTPCVDVTFGADEIVITDNGRGMDLPDLQRFITYAEQNADRAQGRVVRGKFGTGKYAVFKLAHDLEVVSVKNGQRNGFKMSREQLLDVEGSRHGVQPEMLAVNEPTDAPSGTVVRLKRLIRVMVKVADIKRELVKRMPEIRTGIVRVDGQPITYVPPAFVREERRRPSARERAIIGDIELVLRVSDRPLPADEGVHIRANGVLKEISKAGQVNRPGADRIFGFVDCPKLDDESEIPTYDMSRHLRINTQNPVAAALIRFVTTHFEALRQEIEREDRRRELNPDTQIKQLLDQLAGEINRSIDVDAFEDFEGALRGQLIEGEGTGGGRTPKPETAREVQATETNGRETADATARKASGERKYRGKVGLEFRNMGEKEPTGGYERGTLRIHINLDHPYVSKFVGLAADHPEKQGYLHLVIRSLVSEWLGQARAWILATTTDKDKLEILEAQRMLSDPLYRGTPRRAARQASQDQG